MTTLHRNNNGLLSQEADRKTLIFTGYRAKMRHLVKFEVMGPHLNLFQF